MQGPGNHSFDPGPDAGGDAYFGRYRVLTPLGQGAMASVFLAEDPALNRLVAVKVIHPHLNSNETLLERFIVEAKTAAGLRNPNIIEIFDYGEQDGQQYLVMEYVDGSNLQFILNLQNGRPLPAEVAASLLCQAAEGLSAAQKHQVVHRDIKPENMLVNSAGVLKLADFGIAHISEQNLTMTGSILGSPNFMSPEQIDGAKPTHQTDMWALGAVLYYALTGRRPFGGSSIPMVMRNICEAPHAPVLEVAPGADPLLAGLADTLLAKNPADRGQGSRWLAGRLRAFLNQRDVMDITEIVKNHLDGLGNAGNRTLVEPAPPPGSGSGSRGTGAGRREPGSGSRAPMPRTSAAPGSRAFPPGQAGSTFFPEPAFEPPANSAPSMNPARVSRPFFARPLGLGLLGGGVLLLGLLLAFLALNGKDGGGSAGSRAAGNGIDRPNGNGGDRADGTMAEGESSGPASSDGGRPAATGITALRLLPESLEMEAGSRRLIRVEAEPPEARSGISFRSEDSTIAFMAGEELVAKRAGTTRVLAQSPADPSRIAALEVTVTAKIPPSEGKSSAGAGSRDPSQARPAPNRTVSSKAGPKTDPRTASRAAGGSPNPAGSQAAGGALNPAGSQSGGGNSCFLFIMSSPPFAEVMVDGNSWGNTPVRNREVGPGGHKIQLIHRTAPPLDTFIQCRGGTLTFKFRLFKE